MTPEVEAQLLLMVGRIEESTKNTEEHLKRLNGSVARNTKDIDMFKGATRIIGIIFVLIAGVAGWIWWYFPRP